MLSDAREHESFVETVRHLESDWQVWSPNLVESHQLCPHEVINVKKSLPLWPQFLP